MNENRKYGRITIEGKDIPEDEPIFVLRGQDKLAPTAVRLYADLLELAGCRGQMEVRAFAREMEAWQPRKLPD